VLGTGEGLLGVDHPGLAAQLYKHPVEVLGIGWEPLTLEERAEAVEELASEDLAQRTDCEEEGRRSGDPAAVVGVQGPGRQCRWKCGRRVWSQVCRIMVKPTCPAKRVRPN
jgi:hypothetical protein